jgi:pimeloyl-ACP methyl ester carboxylesterase
LPSVVVGELDHITPPAAAKLILERVPNCQMKVMKGVGHLPSQENPGEFNQIVEQFLTVSVGVKAP